MTEREDRLSRLREELSERLFPVCSQWPTELFDEMIRGLAALTYKYDTLPTPITYDPAMTEQIIAELKETADRSAELRKQI